MEVHVIFSMQDVQRWQGKDISALTAEAEVLRLRLKAAAGGRWDTQHFYASQHGDRQTLRLLFWPGHVDAWDKNGRVVALDGQEEAVASKTLIESVRRSICAIEEGLTQCSDCKRWVEDYKKFDFAGAACLECFDPRRHKGPDTRGG